jgi:hypothetical protein
VVDRLELLDPTEISLNLTLKLYAEGKPGVTPDAIRQVGGKLARWPRKLSPEKANYLITFGMYGPALLDLVPVGYHCVAQKPARKIRQFQGKGHEDRLLDKMTLGSKGVMNIDGLARLAVAEVVNIVEGITDLLACQAVLDEWRKADPDNRKHVVLSAGACTNQSESDWMPHFAGQEVRIGTSVQLPTATWWSLPA